jgi:ribonucleotide monophosphatase NagD (HAD superfamily)
MNPKIKPKKKTKGKGKGKQIGKPNSDITDTALTKFVRKAGVVMVSGDVPNELREIIVGDQEVWKSLFYGVALEL